MCQANAATPEDPGTRARCGHRPMDTCAPHAVSNPIHAARMVLFAPAGSCPRDVRLQSLKNPRSIRLCLTGASTNNVGFRGQIPCTAREISEVIMEAQEAHSGNVFTTCHRPGLQIGQQTGSFHSHAAHGLPASTYPVCEMSLIELSSGRGK